MALVIATQGLPQDLDSTKDIVDKYVVENNTVTYVTTFDLPEKTQKEIREMIIDKTSNDSRMSILQTSISENQISGSFKDLEIDVRRFGYKWLNVTSFILHPMAANFTIQFKDYKYRVIIKNVKAFVDPKSYIDLNAFAVKNQLFNSKGALRTYYAFGKTMDEIFDINNYSKKDW
jgi:hypothetical protein